MARSVPASSTRAPRSRGRGAVAQGDTERRPAGDQGTNKAAVEGPEEQGDEDHEEGEEEEDEDSRNHDDTSSSSSDADRSNNDEPELKNPPTRSEGESKRKATEESRNR